MGDHEYIMSFKSVFRDVIFFCGLIIDNSSFVHFIRNRLCCEYKKLVAYY